MEESSNPTASLWRRLAAMVYDGLLLLALLMAATALFLPLTGGEAVIYQPAPVRFIYWMCMTAVWIGFYGLFWVRRNGQTLGMAAWRLKLVAEGGGPILWTDVLRRLGGGALSMVALGLGFFWILIDREQLTWHDRLSRTRPIVLPKRR